MCTEIHIALPCGSDAKAIGTLLETDKAGRGLSVDVGRLPRDLAAADVLAEGEHLYFVAPWNRCHCGWSPSDFAPVVLQALRRGATPWVGIAAFEAGTSSGELERVRVRPEDFAAGSHDEQNVLYIVEPNRTPRPIETRRGPRRRRRHTDS
jgi:hypothetical protein